QSLSAESVTLLTATIFRKAESAAISTLSSLATLSPTGGRRVQRITLSGCGSAEATPCGKNSLRSRQTTAEEANTPDDRQASVAPQDAASSMNVRRVILAMRTYFTSLASARATKFAWRPDKTARLSASARASD